MQIQPREKYLGSGAGVHLHQQKLMALWLYFLFKLICTHVIKEGGVKIASDREKKKMTEMLKLKIIWDTQFSG